MSKFEIGTKVFVKNADGYTGEGTVVPGDLQDNVLIELPEEADFQGWPGGATQSYGTDPTKKYWWVELDCIEEVVNSQPSETGTAKKDHRKDCKPPLKYLHPEFMTGTAFGMLAGEIKYDAWNFLLGHDKQDLTDGAIRHLLDHRAGIQFDDDTTARLAAVFGDKAPRVKHLWLAACNINMMLWQEAYGTAKDSWPKKEQQ